MPSLEPKPPDPHFHECLPPLLAFSCSSLLTSEHAPPAALDGFRLLGDFYAHPHLPCSLGPFLAANRRSLAAVSSASADGADAMVLSFCSFALARLCHGSVLCVLPISCTTLLSFALAHAYSASIAPTAAPPVCLSFGHNSIVALGGFSLGLLLTGRLPTETPLFLCFGPQVSAFLSLVPLQFLLLSRPLGELGLDWYIIDLNLQFACRSILWYFIIICALMLLDHVYVFDYGLDTHPWVDGVVPSPASMALIAWIYPFGASPVGTLWMHFWKFITWALQSLLRSFLLLYLCLSMAFWSDPCIVILIGLWFDLHIWLSRGCVFYGFYYDYAAYY